MQKNFLDRLDCLKNKKAPIILHCKSMIEEAKVISVILKEAVKKQKIALITNNFKLPQMVSLFLVKWNINIEINTTLAQSKEAVFLAKILQEAEKDSSSLLLFPSEDKEKTKNAVKNLKNILRNKESSTIDILEAHINSASEVNPKWSESNEAMQEFIAEAKKTIPKDSVIAPSIYKSLLSSLLGTKKISASNYVVDNHRSITITNPVNARLLRFDKVILADMNEGSWPPKAEKFSEKNIGQSYHDFIGFLGTEEVLITRNEESGSASRWITKLEMEREINEEKKEKWIEWTRELDLQECETDIKHETAKPPRESRPCNFSVSDIKDLIADPYVFYAKKILKLKEIGVIEQRDFGIFTHKALEKYTRKDYKKQEKLLEISNDLLSKDVAVEDRSDFILWWHKFKSFTEWFVTINNEHSDNNIFCEIRGTYQSRQSTETEDAENNQAITITAICDRLEISMGGKANIVDYKTGRRPVNTELKDKLQLMIECFIAENGGFLNRKLHVENLSYWYLRNQQIKKLDIIDERIDINEIFCLLAKASNDGDFPAGEKPRTYSPYSHLARKK